MVAKNVCAGFGFIRLLCYQNTVEGAVVWLWLGTRFDLGMQQIFAFLFANHVQSSKIII